MHIHRIDIDPLNLEIDKSILSIHHQPFLFMIQWEYCITSKWWFSTFSSTTCLKRYDVIKSFWCHHSWEQTNLDTTALLYNDRNLFGKSDVSVAELQSFSFPIWSWVESHDRNQRRNGFSVPSSYAKNQLDLHHCFLERPFVSLSYSLFCHSSPIHLCLGKDQQIHTLKTFLHTPVFRECSGSDLWCFGSNLDHWHFVDSKSTR